MAFWKRVHDEQYVANPANGSGNNRGIAVDVTLVQLHNGMPLDMGTDFDNFTDNAHGNFSQFPSQILANRKLLQNIMKTHGFKALPTKWWYFSWTKCSKFPCSEYSF